jgi:hypothetical protein
MKRLLVLAVLVALPILFGSCGGSSGGSSGGGSSTPGVWDSSTWDSGATWQP